MKKLRAISIETPAKKGIPEDKTGSVNIVECGYFIRIAVNHQTPVEIHNQILQLEPSTFLLLEKAIKEFKAIKL